TGRYAIIFKEEAVGDPGIVRTTLNRVAGIRDLAAARDYPDSAITADALDQKDPHFPRLRAAFVSAADSRTSALAAESAPPANPTARSWPSSPSTSPTPCPTGWTMRPPSTTCAAIATR